MTNIVHHHERVTLQKRRLWLLVAGMAAFCLFGVVAGVWLWNIRQAHRVQAILAVAKARGEPTGTGELNEFYRLPRGEEDASALWIAGIGPLTQSGHNNDARDVPLLADPKMHLWMTASYSSDLPGGEKAYLQKYAASLEKFHEAAAKGGAARLPVDFTPGAATVLPYTQGARAAARLLQLDIVIKSREKDVRGVAKSLHTLLILSRCLEQEPTTVSQLAAMAIERLSDEALAATICEFDFSEDELNQFERVIRARNESKRILRALAGERVLAVYAYENPKSLEPNNRQLFPLKSDLAIYLEHLEKLVAAAKLEFPESIAAAKIAQDQLTEQTSGGLAMLTSSLSRALDFDFKKNLFQTCASTAATNRAALAAIAVERFRRATGQAPQSLQKLIPTYLAAEPIDPFNGKPMIYRVTPKGILIYGVGENLVDDNGEDLNDADRGLMIPLTPTMAAAP